MSEARMVNLDHYNGRNVVDVNDKEGEWQVILEGDIRIINFDEAYDMPDKADLEDKKLQHVTLSMDETKLYFGTDEFPLSTSMVLSPLEYGIGDAERFEGVVRPQAGGLIEDMPVEPAERLADAPDEETEGKTSVEGDDAGEGLTE